MTASETIEALAQPEVAVIEAFSETYTEARHRFLDLVAERGAQLESVPHPSERGADGEELAIDVATFGDPEAAKTFLVVSGTHGQEGFLGSALQLELLRDLEIPDGVNIVALHALNPWGYSHHSRTDENNIDLNRNFLDHEAPFPRNDLYRELFPTLCPEDWTEETSDWSGVLDEMVRVHGPQQMITALSGGQAVEPTGITYVGDRPAWSHTVVAGLLPRVLARAEKVAFIEWHTGIGEWGELAHICSLPVDSSGYGRVVDWLGESARTSFSSSAAMSEGHTPSYTGFFSAWLPSTAPWAEWAGLLVEVGTYDNLTVLNTVRIDRWLKYATGSTYTSREEMLDEMMEGLNPAAPAWREAAMTNGLDAQKRMLEGLARW